MNLEMIILGLILLLVIVLYYITKLRARCQDLYEQTLRKVDRSQLAQTSKVKGDFAEQWAPLLPKFPVKNIGDVFHFGGAVDFLAFDGMSEGNIHKIWFIDSKYGSSRLNNNQKQIKEIIDKLDSNLIEFVKFNPKESLSNID